MIVTTWCGSRVEGRGRYGLWLLGWIRWLLQGAPRVPAHPDNMATGWRAIVLAVSMFSMLAAIVYLAAREWIW